MAKDKEIKYYFWENVNKGSFPVNIVNTDVDECVPKHSHDFHELVIFLHGSSVHKIWGKDGSCYSYGVTQGDVLAVRQNEEHAYENGHEAKFCNLVFRSELISSEIDSLQQFPLWNTFFGDSKSEMRMKCHLNPTALVEAKKYVQRLEREIILQPPGHRMVIKNLFLEILTLILRSPQQKLLETSGTELDLQMLKCLGRIEDTPEYPFTLKDCAKQANMCIASFAQKFRKLTGSSLKEYLLAQRLKKAENMLVQGNNKLDEIAADCGFYDANYLIKVFKRAYNISPAKYRTSRIAKPQTP